MLILMYHSGGHGSYFSVSDKLLGIYSVIEKQLNSREYGMNHLSSFFASM